MGVPGSAARLSGLSWKGETVYAGNSLLAYSGISLN